jgi:hypothetical protein
LGKRSFLMTDDAELIATKLGAEISEGRKHVIAKVRVDGVYIGQFGIRRGANVGHDYIPRQIHVTTRQALSLARCTLYLDGYRSILIDQGILETA